jgi:ATP-binding cassette subfamily B protein
VRFSYRDDQPLLEGLSLTVRPGELLAVVAASGAGKSTLAALLARFLDPRGGRILLDGSDIRELPLAALRRAVCVVEQEPFLFSGPLISNLCYGSPDVPRVVVDEAVRLAGLEPLVDGKQGGLDAVYAESGRDLSGGQKQRIALARAIIRDPAVLVLDEATSALDSEAEEQILLELAPWLARRTVIVMAHRLSTIRRVPSIAVLHEGRIASEGSFGELLLTSAPFRSLFAAQL